MGGDRKKPLGTTPGLSFIRLIRLMPEIKAEFAAAHLRLEGAVNVDTLSRLFTELPVPHLVDPNLSEKLFEQYFRLTTKMRSIAPNEKGYPTLVDFREAIEVIKFIKYILNTACNSLLDKNGAVNDAWVKLVGLEQYISEMNTPENTKAIIASFVKTIFQGLDFRSKRILGEVGADKILAEYVEGDIALSKLSADQQHYMAIVAINTIVKKNLYPLLELVLTERGMIKFGMAVNDRLSQGDEAKREVKEINTSAFFAPAAAEPPAPDRHENNPQNQVHGMKEKSKRSVKR